MPKVKVTRARHVVPGQPSSSVTAYPCFMTHVGKQPMTWKGYYLECWLKNSRKIWIGALAAVTELK